LAVLLRVGPVQRLKLIRVQDIQIEILGLGLVITSERFRKIFGCHGPGRLSFRQFPWLVPGRRALARSRRGPHAAGATPPPDLHVLPHEATAALENLLHPGVRAGRRPNLHIGGLVHFIPLSVEDEASTFFVLPSQVCVRVLAGSVSECPQAHTSCGSAGKASKFQEVAPVHTIPTVPTRLSLPLRLGFAHLSLQMS